MCFVFVIGAYPKLSWVGSFIPFYQAFSAKSSKQIFEMTNIFIFPPVMYNCTISVQLNLKDDIIIHS